MALVPAGRSAGRTELTGQRRIMFGERLKKGRDWKWWKRLRGEHGDVSSNNEKLGQIKLYC